MQVKRVRKGLCLMLIRSFQIQIRIIFSQINFIHKVKPKVKLATAILFGGKI